MERKFVKIILSTFLLIAGMVFQQSCSTTEDEEGCSQLEYDGSYLIVDELSFCPAVLTVDKIQNFEHEYLEQKIISHFTTDYGDEIAPGRILDAKIVIRTPYPNQDNLELPQEFEGTYLELKQMGFVMDISLEELTPKPVNYEIDIDSHPDMVNVYLKLDNLEEFIAVNVNGQVILGEDQKLVKWQSEFRFMD